MPAIQQLALGNGQTKADLLCQVVSIQFVLRYYNFSKLYLLNIHVHIKKGSKMVASFSKKETQDRQNFKKQINPGQCGSIGWRVFHYTKRLSDC